MSRIANEGTRVPVPDPLHVLKVSVNENFSTLNDFVFFGFLA